MAKVELKDAVKKLEGDKELQKKFRQDPKGTLATLGVDTANMTISPVKDNPTGPSNSAGICVEVGFPIIGCSSVGV